MNKRMKRVRERLIQTYDPQLNDGREEGFTVAINLADKELITVLKKIVNKEYLRNDAYAAAIKMQQRARDAITKWETKQ